MSSKTFVGVDIAKGHLDVAQVDQRKSLRLDNNAEGLAQLVKHLKNLPNPVVVMEATGGYERAAAEALLEAEIAVCVVNARWVRKFAEAAGISAKTDSIDAWVLAWYGQAMNPPVLTRADPTRQEVDELVRRRRELVDSRSAEKNRLQQVSPRLRPSIEEHIDFLDEQIEKLDKLIQELIEGDHKAKMKAELMRSVKGIGPVVCATLVAQMPELGTLNSKQIAALAGLAPYNDDSGNSKHVRHIRGGRSEVRDMLFMAVRTGVQFNDRLKALYERLLAAGKLKKVAHIACARKLLTWLNAMLKHNCPWDERLFSAA